MYKKTIAIPVRRTSSWGMASSSVTTSEFARIYTNAPEYLSILEIRAEVEGVMTIESAIVEVSAGFPDDGFIATSWQQQSHCYSPTGSTFGDDTGDCSSLSPVSDIRYRVQFEYGSQSELEGREFQAVFAKWLESAKPEALRFLGEHSTFKTWVRRTLLRAHFWGTLAIWLRLWGTKIPKIGARAQTFELDRGVFRLRCWNHLAPVRIAQAFGFETRLPEPEGWTGVRDASELTLP